MRFFDLESNQSMIFKDFVWKRHNNITVPISGKKTFVVNETGKTSSNPQQSLAAASCKIIMI